MVGFGRFTLHYACYRNSGTNSNGENRPKIKLKFSAAQSTLLGLYIASPSHRWRRVHLPVYLTVPTQDLGTAIAILNTTGLNLAEFETCMTLVFCLACISTLKTEVAFSSETLVDFQRTTRCHINEDRTLYSNCDDNLISYSIMEFTCRRNG
jgi:hypothetical protein